MNAGYPTTPMALNQHHQILPNGRNYWFVDEGPSAETAKATLLCLHGFPDQWYGWKHQIGPWANAGYRVIALHMLGYGSSDKPAEPSAYSTKSLCDDLVQLLDILEVQTAVLIGHDWGALVAWRFALWYPSRIRKLVVISIPYFPPVQEYHSPIDISPIFGYQEYFADPSSTKEIEDNLDMFLPSLFQVPPKRSAATNSAATEGATIKEAVKGRPILLKGQMQALVTSDRSTFILPDMAISPEELAEYTSDFRKGGMHGPLSYYRTSQIRFEEERSANLSVPQTLPVLLIYGAKDPTCITAYREATPSHVRNLTVIRLEETGHWILYEDPERVVEEVSTFLSHDAEPE